MEGFEVFIRTSLALICVIALLCFCGWLMAKINAFGGVTKKHLNVISATQVGPKERVVIVQVEDHWMVLGVSAGSVNLLETLDIPESAVVLEPPKPVRPAFSESLSAAFRHLKKK